MASSVQHLLFCFMFMVSISIAQRPSIPNQAMVLPVTKQASTLQYLTRIEMGTPLSPITLLVDLDGPFLWVDSSSRHVSSSYRPIKCGSLQCSLANTTTCLSRSNTSCSLYPENSITRMVTLGDLVEDTVAVRSESGEITAVNNFLFSCAPNLLLKGLASGVKGVLGLGRSRISLPSQIATAFGSHRKFTVCLSSSDGVIISGESQIAAKISKSLTYTPLISTTGTNEYYINVKSIKINGKRLSLDTSLLRIRGTKISTIVPYTTLESRIFEVVTKAYIEAANVMNMTRVASVAPFEVCFSSSGVDETTPMGPTVPAIDFVLQSEMVKWRLYGRNTMVKVSDEVMCLGLLDGGVRPRASIVIGGYQLEDNMLEFNLATSMLGFSSSLLMRQTSCSSLNLYSTLAHDSI